MPDASGAVRRAEDFVRSHPTLAALLLLLPLFLLLIAFFVVPLLQLLNLSLLAQQPTVRSGPASHGRDLRQDPGDSVLPAGDRQLDPGRILHHGDDAADRLSGRLLHTRISGWERTLISVACLLPLFVNVIVGILGWYILLLPNGVIQQVLARSGWWMVRCNGCAPFRPSWRSDL